jgi:hypothetical protein
MICEDLLSSVATVDVMYKQLSLYINELLPDLSGNKAKNVVHITERRYKWVATVQLTAKSFSAP